MESLRRSGAETSFRRPSQLVVSTGLPHFPNSTNSFWLTYQNGYWYLGTWAPLIYKIPRNEQLVELAMECLKLSDTAIASIPDHVIIKFGLRLMTDAQADKLLHRHE